MARGPPEAPLVASPKHVVEADGRVRADAAQNIQAERYARLRTHGTPSHFAALDVASGQVIGECFPRHRSVEFRRFLDCSIPQQAVDDL